MEKEKILLLGEEELESRLIALSGKIRTYRAPAVFFIVFFAVWIITAILFIAFNPEFKNSPIMPYVFYVSGLWFAGGLVFGVLWYSADGKIWNLLIGNIVRSVLPKVFTVESWEPQGRIDEEEIRKANLVPGWNISSGDMLVKGSYRGLKFSFSNMTLVEYRQSNTGRGKSRIRRKNRFRGQWFICDLAKYFEAPVLLAPRTGTNADREIETVNPAFNRKYRIAASDPGTALYVLTPCLMDYILNTDRLSNARTWLCFTGNQVHIAFNRKHTLFNIKTGDIGDIDDVNRIRDLMLKETEYFTGIMDELLMNVYLFGAASLSLN